MLKVRLFTLLTLLLLSGCTALGLAGTEALVVTGAVATTAAVAVDIGESSPVKVYGNYGDEHGYWFDKELYFIWVTSDSTDVSERVARATATDSCVRRGKALRVTDTSAWREWPPFAPIYRKSFAFEMKFRCDNEHNDLL
ncbi:MAG: hypothetical protein OQL18_02770 [Deltaproteobacteria bacterium]|nr:hypothetical protein [Deltaproteobacteria bacterium]